MSRSFCTLIEVGPRDGLQNIPEPVPLATKKKLIQDLYEAGLSWVEATSFVHPKWVPQLADSQELVGALSQELRERSLYLLPNQKGWQIAESLGLKKIALFTAASESFHQKNLNCEIEKGLERISSLVEQMRSQIDWLRIYVSTCFICPFEGEISASQAMKVLSFLAQLDCDEIVVSDTVGSATPQQVGVLLKELKKEVESSKIAVHFHDTYGFALANICRSFEEGIDRVDSSIGGLGGCPYAPGATGNVATEDVVYLCDRLGVKTGIDLERLKECLRDHEAVLGSRYASHLWNVWRGLKPCPH